ncbi:class I SAM-dependent RNA methyltransferase [Roseomonas elaeocarpi]|uniref:Class I SAM-dependent RNA methyltransferase n=1 Tax=Roseomonas elaeocarpi TaxID=907779 RepID=A0ABV6JUC6_9PROT
MLEVEVTAVGSAGDGIATLGDGRTVALPFTLPGERVTARETGRRGEVVLAEAEAVLQPGPDRVAPPCRHFGICGGCALQHWAEAPYRAWKRRRLVEALERAGFADAPVGECAPCPPRTRRRADLAIRQVADGVAIGFHARGDARVVDMRECHVLHPTIFALLEPLRTLVAKLRGFRREGSALINLLDSGPDLLLRTDDALTPGDRQLLAAFAAEHGVRRIAWAKGQDVPEMGAQTGTVGLRLGDATVAPAPGAFLQAAPEGEAAIVAAVIAGLPRKLPAKARVADLYAGVGTISLPLSRHVRVEAFEGEAAAVAALSAGANAAGARVTAKRRDLARQPLLLPELASYATVVLDPPFNGAAEQMALIARSKLRRVIYVSCNPAALARDAALLRKANWRVEAATPVDQFLWSPHLEAVVTFAQA